MPGQIGPHRGHRNVGHALAQGVVAAYRHRGVIKRVAHHAKTVVKKVFKKKITTKKVTRKSDQPDTGVGAEFTKMSISFGKPKVEKLPKLIQASIKTQTCRLSLLSQFDNPASATTQPGSLGLNNFQLNGSGNTAYPLHLIDVTSWINNIGGQIIYSAPIYSMVTDVNGNVSFAVAPASYSIEQAADRTVDAVGYTRESDLLKKVTAMFLFYGCTAKPTKFTLDLISIADDSLHPDVTPATVINGSEYVNYGTARSAFWTAMVRPYLWNPLMIGDTKSTSGKKYKVHQHSQFLLQEKLSNEPSSFAGHMKQVDYNLHFDRLQRYDWNNKTLTQPGFQGILQGQEINDLTTFVPPKRRLYIMVRAQSTYNTGATVDPTKNPSYDLLLRSTHQSVI